MPPPNNHRPSSNPSSAFRAADILARSHLDQLSAEARDRFDALSTGAKRDLLFVVTELSERCVWNAIGGPDDQPTREMVQMLAGIGFAEMHLQRIDVHEVGK